MKQQPEYEQPHQGKKKFRLYKGTLTEKHGSIDINLDWCK